MKRICLLVGLLGLALAPAVEAHDPFQPAPPHTQRLGLKTFHVDKGWWDRNENQQCPGSYNDIDHYVQEDGSVVVQCAENTFFDPEVATIPDPVAFLRKINPSSTPAVNKYLSTEKHFTRTVTTTQTTTVPLKTVTKHVAQRTPMLAWTIIFIIIGIGIGTIFGFVISFVKSHNS